MKTIYIEPAWKTPLSVQRLAAMPPAGYRFITANNSQQNVAKSLSKYNFSYDLLSITGRFISIQLLRSQLGKFRSPPKNSHLTYSLHHLIMRNEPWILDLTTELPFILAWNEKHLSRNKLKIEKVLASENCRKILCQVNKGKEAVLATFGEKLEHKTEVMPWTVTTKNIEKRRKSNKIRLLFINSGNINTAGHFFGKGGMEVVESYKILQRKYNNLELILRSGIPDNLKMQFAQIKNLSIIDRPVPWSQLESLWLSSDICVLPNHYNTSAQVFLDAMSYGLPIVTTDTWANSEIVTEGKTGFLVHNPKAARYTEGPLLHLNSEYLKEISKSPSSDIIEGLVEKLSLLIDNEKQRQIMGQNGKDEIDAGRFSQKRIITRLKHVLDDATS
jgi:glycosyltransferase involved in cell wall biosynthesis